MPGIIQNQEHKISTILSEGSENLEGNKQGAKGKGHEKAFQI